MGDTAGCVNEFLEPADEAASREPVSESFEFVDDCELGLRGSKGRRFAADEAATNFLVVPGAFFFPGEGADFRTSRPVAAVLPDEGI